jgi:nucleotide-binding universal stress UspA family protein
LPLAERKQSDAIVLNTRGRSRLEAFFMGETARKVLEFARICPSGF